jgi:hypothetical protein
MLNNIITYIINDIIYNFIISINIEEVIFAYLTYKINMY